MGIIYFSKQLIENNKPSKEEEKDKDEKNEEITIEDKREAKTADLNITLIVDNKKEILAFYKGKKNQKLESKNTKKDGYMIFFF